ncbi:MAG: DUF4783 domain-containing protein [Bacteroidetes bacterium]|nr:DUF4783 domain-containing protein [Bacteroidota bacterium]
MKTVLAFLIFSFPFAAAADNATMSVDLMRSVKLNSIVDIVDDVAQAIRSGNAEDLSKYFADNVDLKVLEQENIYSRAQAELILKDFFAKHPVQEFTIVHKSTANNESQFAIGTLKTANGTYRVHYLLKGPAGSTTVSQFRIENSDE